MFHSLKNNISAKGLIVIIISFLSFGLIQSQNDYLRLLDSADYHSDYEAKMALTFLDSIPHPVENYIKGHLAQYYIVKSLIHNDFNEEAEMYNSIILALKYAKREKNYRVAGLSCAELYSILYSEHLDSIAQVYLDKAKMYYELSGYKNGLVEVEQLKMYADLMDGNHRASIEAILKKLNAYKKIEDNQYFYLFGLYMLVCNYIDLGEFENAHIYFKELYSLQNNQTISEYNFDSFEGDINTYFAQGYYNKKMNDSSLFYLSKASAKKAFMSNNTLRIYFGTYADVYARIGEIENSRAYLDSLRRYEDKIFKNTLNSSFYVNKTLLETELELTEESEKKYFFRLLGIVFFGVLLVLSIVYLLFYRRQKLKLNYLDAQNKNLSHLKNTHEKLTVKVQGLEDYIGSLKNKVKLISGVNEVSTQKEMIKEFYKDLHLNSSTIIDESNNHLDLVNDFNINFFNKLKNLYPQLNDSEIIICYHIYIGFKNKEIALFLNTTVRAVESKRYRITKKLNFHKDKTTLYEFLKSTFPE